MNKVILFLCAAMLPITSGCVSARYEKLSTLQKIAIVSVSANGQVRVLGRDNEWEVRGGPDEQGRPEGVPGGMSGLNSTYADYVFAKFAAGMSALDIEVMDASNMTASAAYAAFKKEMTTALSSSQSRPGAGGPPQGGNPPSGPGGGGMGPSAGGNPPSGSGPGGGMQPPSGPGMGDRPGDNRRGSDFPMPWMFSTAAGMVYVPFDYNSSSVLEPLRKLVKTLGVDAVMVVHADLAYDPETLLANVAVGAFILNSSGDFYLIDKDPKKLPHVESSEALLIAGGMLVGGDNANKTILYGTIDAAYESWLSNYVRYFHAPSD